MKIFLSFLVAVLALQNVESGRKVHLPSEIDIPSMKHWIVETVVNGFTDRLISKVRTDNSPKDIPFTLLPPIDDPATLEPANIPLDINFDIDGSPIRIAGYLNLTEQATVTGLGELVDDLVIVTPFLRPIEIDLNIELPSLVVTGKHSVEVEVDLGTSKVITGEGDLLVNIDSVFAKAHAVTKTNGAFLGIATFVLDIGFQNLLIDGGESVCIDDLLIDWANISEGIQTWFDSIWNGEVKCLVDRTLTCAVDHVIGGCTAADLIGGTLDCLRLELKPECIELLDPIDGECVQQVTTTKPDTTVPPATNDPTSGPTNAPTSGPTNAPTSGPTNAPTSGPTNAPTSGPTNAPTSGPTNDPGTGSTQVTEDTQPPDTTRATAGPGPDTTEQQSDTTEKPNGAISTFGSPLVMLMSFMVAIIKI